ncbi:hypothetical protein FQN57_004405 [Myotisia sp. PD_48]|nr:hypothetical protein FQN57_004405 [Myotisia sp. PD_48]
MSPAASELPSFESNANNDQRLEATIPGASNPGRRKIFSALSGVGSRNYPSASGSASTSSPPDELALQPLDSNHRFITHSPSEDPDSYTRHSISDGEETDGEMAASRPQPRPRDSRSKVPLLKDETRGRLETQPNSLEEGRAPLTRARSSFRSRSPDYARNATRRKYIYASFFLVLSLISFTVQTQTAVYIQQELGWNKPYCMLYLTHGSWIFLWPFQLLILRIQKRQLSWAAFWRRHVSLLRSTAQMVESQDLHLTPRDTQKSPVRYMIRTTVMITSALTVAGGSWYVAVDMTTGSDLTAIYNCSAFFAYAFSIPLLHEKLRFDKVSAVLIAVVGVVVIAYGPGGPPAETPSDGAEASRASNRMLGNLIIGGGSVLYGLYEVLYKRFACPPEGTSSGRGIIFANAFASLIGLFTVLVLWIPLPLLHLSGLETFQWPRGETAGLLAISTLSNAIFSGSFLVLISLTSPVLSSVAALLTIFIVALVDWKFNHKSLSSASIIGGVLIVVAFLLLSWSTYRELDEERKRRLAEEGPDSDTDD